MTNLRSAIADWITIFTGLITIGSGLFALSQGVGESTETVGWSYYINHAVASLISFITFVFFAAPCVSVNCQSSPPTSATRSGLLQGPQVTHHNRMQLRG